jgi:hypothetical protein
MAFNQKIGFGDMLAYDLIKLVNRVYENKPSIIIVSGPLGSGKTTLGVRMADVIEGKEIIMSEQLSNGGADFQEKLQRCVINKRKTIIYDEAGDFNKKSVMTRFNKNMNRIWDTFRTHRIIPIIILPDVMNLDSQPIRNQSMRLLVHCGERDKSGGKYKGYSLADYFWLAHHSKKAVIKPSIYATQKPLYKERFIKLSEERQKELDQISTQAKLGIIDKINIEQQGLLNTNQIVDKLNITKRTLFKYQKDYNMKPKISHNNMNYYDDEFVSLLESKVGKGHGKKKQSSET